MSKPQVTILTPTYNKPQFLAEAANSVLRQTFPNWNWWIVLDGADAETQAVAIQLARCNRITLFDEKTTDEQRRAEYRPAAILNKYYPKIHTNYLCWLSDDDLFEPVYLELLVGALESQPEYEVAFGACEVVKQAGSEGWRHYRWLRAKTPIGKGTGVMPDFVIDGGQILQTKSSYELLQGYQLPIDWISACHVDGIYMNELARHFCFLPVREKVLTHRCTYLSTHTKGKRLG